LVVELKQMRDLLSTWTAPRRPEVYHHWLSIC
jgi:hypothetical protein